MLRSYSLLYNTMIKYALIAVFCLQVALTQQILSLPHFDPTQNNFEETFKCYLEQNLIKGSIIMTLNIWDLVYQWESSNNLTNPQQAYEIYNEPVHVVIYTHRRDDHSLYGQLVQKAFKNQPIKAVWVMVSNASIKSCDQLKGFLRDLRRALGPDRTIGILTGPQYWSNSFTTKQGCPEVPLEHPLIYVSSYFETFIPFGGWKKAEYIFASQEPVQTCQIKGRLSSIYYYTKQ